MILRKSALVFIPVLLLLVLAACDSGTPGTATPNGQTVPSTSAPQSNNDSLFVTFETSGGVAGQDTKLAIAQSKVKFDNGSKSTKSNDLSAADYNTLKQKIAAADFFNLKDTYDKGGVADDIYYTITVQQASQSKTVKVAQVGGKDLTPQPLQDLITELNTIQSSVSK